MFRLEDIMHIPMQPYMKQLACYPVIMMNGKERSEVEKGGKIILPASALEYLTRLHIEYPMLFRLNNKSKKRQTHCGVLEFVAEEGRCYLPYWMMKNLLVNEGEVIQVEYVNLPIAKFAKFQPQSVDFLEITNPKAVLENTLRNFATLTKGDVISINYNDKIYELCILETRPGEAVSIIECDMDVDFAAPVGYEEPQRPAKEASSSNQRAARATQQLKENIVQVPQGYRLDGKSTKKADDDLASAIQAQANQEKHKRGIPDYHYKFGYLHLNQFIESKDQEMQVEKPKEIGGYKLKHIGKK